MNLDALYDAAILFISRDVITFYGHCTRGILRKGHSGDILHILMNKKNVVTCRAITSLYKLITYEVRNKIEIITLISFFFFYVHFITI